MCFCFLLIYYSNSSNIIPTIEGLKPTDATQLVLGNYTNVLSALGASIAVGTGVVVHTKVAQIQKNHETLKKPHDEMKDLLEKLHSKLDTCYVLFKN